MATAHILTLSLQGYLERWVAGVQRSAETRLQACLLGLLFTAQRLLRWVQLAAMALTLQRTAEAQQQQQQQMQLAYSGSAAGGSGADAPSASGSPSPASGSPAPEAGSMIGFIGGAATGAVEQLRHTLNDAGAGMGEKMAALERTASSLQSSLFRAAQEHSAAVRSNPSGGMWKQPSVDAVISEEERLRAAVFAQVGAATKRGGARHVPLLGGCGWFGCGSCCEPPDVMPVRKPVLLQTGASAGAAGLLR